MSARGRKLTALTPRKANSRKIIIRRQNAESLFVFQRKSNAGKGLREAMECFL
jgi:hypothetical protein